MPTDTFQCPTCKSSMPLSDYLKHAGNCGALNNPKPDKAAANSGQKVVIVENPASAAGHMQMTPTNAPSNIRAPPPPTSTTQATPESVPGVKCPLCLTHISFKDYTDHAMLCTPAANGIQTSQNGSIEKRNNDGEAGEDDNRKRARLVNGAGVGEPEYHYQNQRAAAAEEAHQHQAPTQAYFMNPGMTAPSQVVTYTLSDTSSPMSRANTPLQHRMGPSAAVAANYHHDYAPAPPQPQFLHQMNPPRKIVKEETRENRTAGASANVGAVGNGTSAAATAELVVTNLLPFMRRTDKSIDDMRRRMEMFEASLMMKLGNIESTLSSMKDEQPPAH